MEKEKTILDYDTVALDEAQDAVIIIDQTLLPGRIELIALHTAQEIWDAIYLLKVRGAPAIGVAAALGIYLLANRIETEDFEKFYEKFTEYKEYLDSSRPTAVNLSWALKRMNAVAVEAGREEHKTVAEVKEILHDKDNELKVILHSPNKWIREAFKKCRTLGNDDTFEGFVHLRKAHYMFGWDWGAHLPDAGIFRPVSLLGINTARIDSVYIKQTHERTGETEPGTVRPITKSVTLTFDVEQEVVGNAERGPKLKNITGGHTCKKCGKAYTYTVEITAPDGSKTLYENSPVEVKIDDPKLWWPNGYGEQNLYEVKVTLFSDGVALDEYTGGCHRWCNAISSGLFLRCYSVTFI